MKWALADQVLGSAQNFAVGLAVARLAGIEAFGTFTLVFIIAMLAAVVQDAYLAAPMMTYAGGAKRRTNAYFSSVARSSLLASVGGGLVVAICVSLVVFLRDGRIPLVLALVGAAATATNSHFGILKRILFANHQARAGFLLSVLRAASLLALAVVVVAGGLGASPEIWLGILAVASLTAGFAATIRLARPRTRRMLYHAVWIKHWGYARWLMFMIAVSMAQEQYVWLLVGLIEGDAALGGMRAGHYLLGLTHVIMIGMHNFIAVEAARASTAGGTSGLTRYLFHQTLVLGVMVGGVILCLGLFAETWMRLVFGSDYVDYASVMRWFCLIYMIVFVREVWVIYLRTVEKTRSIFVAFAISSLFALAFTYPAIKTAGLNGALVVILLAHTISLALVALAVLKHHHSESRDRRHSPDRAADMIG